MKLYLFLLAAIATLSLSEASVQTVKVYGRVRCGNAPLVGIRVLLEDYDWGPDPDDEMAEVLTDSNGEFVAEGRESEAGNIDPVIKIYHDCNDGLPCQRKWERKIPKKYINKPGGVNIGDINLEMENSSEERSC